MEPWDRELCLLWHLSSIERCQARERMDITLVGRAWLFDKARKEVIVHMYNGHYDLTAPCVQKRRGPTGSGSLTVLYCSCIGSPACRSDAVYDFRLYSCMHWGSRRYKPTSGAQLTKKAQYQEMVASMLWSDKKHVHVVRSFLASIRLLATICTN